MLCASLALPSTLIFWAPLVLLPLALVTSPMASALYRAWPASSLTAYNLFFLTGKGGEGGPRAQGRHSRPGATPAPAAPLLQPLCCCFPAAAPPAAVPSPTGASPSSRRSSPSCPTALQEALSPLDNLVLVAADRGCKVRAHPTSAQLQLGLALCGPLGMNQLPGAHTALCCHRSSPCALSNSSGSWLRTSVTTWG
jgi:hypothetical protein